MATKDKSSNKIEWTRTLTPIIIALISAIVSIVTVYVSNEISPKSKVSEVDNKVAEQVNKKIDTIGKTIVIEQIPIGTITTSMMRYNTFLEINGLIVTENMSKVKWVPCDGREVKSSKYGKVNDSVPDLRGLFLRNVNDYDVGYNGTPSVNPIHMNPENTKVGIYQDDDYESHIHGLVWWASGGMNKPNTYPGINNSYNPGYNQSSDKGVTPSGGKETRPKNMTVYYYIKIN